MRITFNNREEWIDFISSFRGEGYSFAIKLDGSYELLSFDQLRREYAEFPLEIEGGTDVIQICGIREGEKIRLCSFREAKEAANTGKDAFSRVITLNDWYDSNRRYIDALSPYLSDALLNSVKRRILTDGHAYKF